MTPPPPSRIDAQLQQGYAAIAAMLNYWVGRSGLNGGQFCRIAAWALGEACLETGQLSRIRNAKIARGCGLKDLLAFDAANVAIWTWQTVGKEKAWDRFGPHTPHGIRDLWLDDALWLPVPEEPDQPLQFPDFAEVLVGRLVLPFATGAAIAADAARLSEALSGVLNAEVTRLGLTPRDGLKRIREAYPIASPDRQSRLMELLLGTTSLSREELETELHALAETIRVLRDLKPGSYGPGELSAELSAVLPES